MTTMITDEESRKIFGEVCEIAPGFLPKNKSVSQANEDNIAHIALTKQLHERIASLEGRFGWLSSAHNKNAVTLNGLENKLANESI